MGWLLARTKDGTPGLGLVEAYDLNASAPSQLGNLSSRGLVGTADDVLVSGLIIGDVEHASVVLRALGPSLASANVANALSNPVLSVYDKNGMLFASNDNWQDDVNSPDVEKNGLAPTDPAESAIVLNLPAGSYTAVVSGANGSTGNALVEIYNLQ
jgi:hypothetical protein